VLIAFLLPAIARAHSAAALQQFGLGKQAFAVQDYEKALGAFEAAAAAGMSGPAVQFNIGVCAYKTGRWARAESAFTEVARTPEMAALAHYNLGLVALGAGRQDEAMRWFTRVERESNEDRLRSLAIAQLTRMPPPPERNWFAFGSFAAGYDDNVALVSGGDVLGVSGTDDTFGELQILAAAPLSGPWRFDGGLVLLDYQDLNEFDQLSLNAGARYRVPVGKWNVDTALQLAYSTLDGEGFENKQALLLQAARPLTDEWRVRARYRFSKIDGLGGFSGLDGHKHDVGLRGTWRRGPWDVTIDYRFDKTDYDEATLSYDRHQISADLQYELDGNWTVEAGLSRDRSRYDVSANGTEDRTELSLGVSREFGDTWRALVRYSYANNEADLPEFDYGRNRISAGIEASW
jgi:tetratricopeptide (TPR) repeat protein